jgi:cytochrome P450
VDATDATTSGHDVDGQPSALPFERMPVIEPPPDYALEMPTFLARMYQRYGPIFRRPLHLKGPLARYPDSWIVYMVGPGANRFVMHSHRDRFSHDLGWTPNIGGVFEKGLLNTDDPEHARQRKMMNPAFAVAYMSRYLPIMNRVIEERSRDWAARGEVDLYEEARKITFDVAAESLAGFRTGADVDQLRQLFYELIHGDEELGVATHEELWQRAVSVRDQLNGMLLEMIAERRRAPTDDILGTLAQARDDDGQLFTDTQLLGQLHILLVAGHETSTTMAAWLLYLLASHPAYLARVHAELDDVLGAPSGAVTLESIRAMRVLGYALDEAGRLRSPVGNVPRGVVQDFTFGGYQVPAGTRVLLSLAACHRLPEIFADPDRFDPDRFAPPREEDKRAAYALVPFGGGPRICIGINFVQVEIKALAAHALRTYTLEPIEGQPIVHAYYGPVANLVYGMPVHVRWRA